MGIKFLRDGQDSASMVAMYSVAGQPTWNIFANTWSNHIPSTVEASLLPVAVKFSSVTKYITEVGLSDIASYDVDGTKVETPVFPYQMIFTPTGEVEFPDDYDGTWYTDQLMSIPSGTKLWYVTALDAPAELGGKEYFIGDFVTTSEFTTSMFGDTGLFFRHQWLDDDLEIMPDWTPYENTFPPSSVRNFFNAPKKILSSASEKVKSACPFAHLWQ